MYSVYAAAPAPQTLPGGEAEQCAPRRVGFRPRRAHNRYDTPPLPPRRLGARDPRHRRSARDFVAYTIMRYRT